MPIKNRKTYNDYQRGYRQQKREEMIMKLGGKCERCKDTRIEFLGVSKKGKVLCFNCRDLLKRKKVETKKVGIKK